jgi:hypothetical protein
LPGAVLLAGKYRLNDLQLILAFAAALRLDVLSDFLVDPSKWKDLL